MSGSLKSRGLPKEFHGAGISPRMASAGFGREFGALAQNYGLQIQDPAAVLDAAPGLDQA